jgi:hypothetical protein
MALAVDALDLTLDNEARHITGLFALKITAAIERYTARTMLA